MLGYFPQKYAIISFLSHYINKIKRHPKTATRKSGCFASFVIHIGFEPMTSSLSRKRSKPTELMNRYVVIRLGLKPRTRSLEGCCSIQLSYRTGEEARPPSLCFVPGPGLEPGWVAPTVFETVASAYSAIRACVPQLPSAKLHYFFILTKFRTHISAFSASEKHKMTNFYLAEMPRRRSRNDGPVSLRSTATSLLLRLRKIIAAGRTMATHSSNGTMALMRFIAIL